MKTLRVWLLAAGLVSLANCSGGSTSSQTPCSTPAVPAYALVAPAAGSTNVATTLGQIGVSQSFATSIVSTFSLQTSSGATVAATVIGTYQPIATGVSVPPAATPISGYLATVPPLAPLTTYSVIATYSLGVQSTSCPTAFTSSAGSFTTGAT